MPQHYTPTRVFFFFPTRHPFIIYAVPASDPWLVRGLAYEWPVIPIVGWPRYTYLALGLVLLYFQHTFGGHVLYLLPFFATYMYMRLAFCYLLNWSV